MRYCLVVFLLFLASNSFAQDKITKKSITDYLKRSEKVVLDKDINGVMDTVATEAVFTMYEEHDGKIVHYHFDRNSYKQMMLECLKQYKYVNFNITKIRSNLDPTGLKANISYNIESTVLIEGVKKEYVTNCTEKIILRNGKIQVVAYESIMKY